MINGRLVRILRKKQKKSQTVLAAEVGVCLRTIQGWEKEENSPQSVEKLYELAEALGVTPAELQLNFYQLLQEEAIITLFKIKTNLEMVDPDEYNEYLHHYHDAVLKTLKVGGVDPSLAWKNNRAAEDIEHNYAGNQNNTDDSDDDIDSFAEEFENGDHDDADAGSDLPKASSANPYE